MPLDVSTDRTSGRHNSVHLLKYFSEVQQWKEGHMAKKTVPNKIYGSLHCGDTSGNKVAALSMFNALKYF